MAQISHVAPGDYVLLYDKPAGITSHDVVARVRRTLPRRTKVGHAGTLDPFATGLLLVLVGRATRVQRFLMELPKRYEVTARFGAVSSTGDPEGEIVQTGVVPEGALELPSGGCASARRPTRRSRWGAGAPTSWPGPGWRWSWPSARSRYTASRSSGATARGAAFVIECSSGTYVRSLVAALGDAYCEQLRRTRIGSFDVGDADPERPVELNRALGFLPELALDAEQARRVGHGGRESPGHPGAGPVRSGGRRRCRAPDPRRHPGRARRNRARARVS